MLTKTVLLLTWMITINVHWCAANCQTFYQRLIDKGVTVYDPGRTRESIKNHWTSICKDTNALADSYDQSIATECTVVSLVVPFYEVNSTQRQAIGTLCSDIDGLMEYIVCLMESASSYIKVLECLKQNAISSCKVDTCIRDVIKDACDKPAVDFVINTRIHCLAGRNSTNTCMECTGIGVKTTPSFILVLCLFLINYLLSFVQAR